MIGFRMIRRSVFISGTFSLGLKRSGNRRIHVNISNQPSVLCAVSALGPSVFSLSSISSLFSILFPSVSSSHDYCAALADLERKMEESASFGWAPRIRSRYCPGARGRRPLRTMMSFVSRRRFGARRIHERRIGFLGSDDGKRNSPSLCNIALLDGAALFLPAILFNIGTKRFRQSKRCDGAACREKRRRGVARISRSRFNKHGETRSTWLRGVRDV